MWDLQRAYFERHGIDAWRSGEVPHYATSHPALAAAYAEIVVAFLQDESALRRPEEPVLICELGCGSGRFAWHVLSHLERLCGDRGVPLGAFRYLLTDFVPANVEFCLAHPRLRRFVDSGRLDGALLDIGADSQLRALAGRAPIDQRLLRHPPIVIANYVFDSVPSELYYVTREGIWGCGPAWYAPDASKDDDPAARIVSLRLTPWAPGEPIAESDPAWRRLQDYTSTPDRYVPYPSAALALLETCRAWSQRGAFVLCADKGDLGLDDSSYLVPPSPVRHGSFSLPVNYYLLARYCELEGGLALRQSGGWLYTSVLGLLLVEEPARYAATRLAYRRHVDEFSPDNFTTVATAWIRHVSEMTCREILAFARFTRFDAHQFSKALDRLDALCPHVSPAEARELSEVAERVWDGYYALGEKLDLAFRLGSLLYSLGQYGPAASFFGRSIDIYGDYTGTLLNLGACLEMLGDHPGARRLAERVLEAEPDSPAAARLLARCQPAADGPPARRP